MQERDFRWYIDNFDMLFDVYGNSYIAIKNEKVLGSYSSYAEGVRETSKTEELGSFIVQKCGKDESAYTACIASMNFI